MGYILPNFYQELSNQSNRPIPKILIETGTFKGGLSHIFLEKLGSIEPFKKIYTFELGENIAKIASKRFRLFEEYLGDTSKFDFHTDDVDTKFVGRASYLYDQIELINSDSVKGLSELLPKIDEPCCFWLDAHAGASKYARGPKDVPLLDELEVISNHHIKNHIIAIDDAHMFGKIQYHNKTNEKLCDYTESNEENIIKYLKKINNNYIIEYGTPYGCLMLYAY